MSHYYSAHGDQTKLLDYIFNLEGYTSLMRETVVFINHGESNGKSAFREAIEKRASQRKPSDRRVSDIQVANRQWFNLDTRCYEDGPRPEDELKKAMLEKGLSAEDVKKLIEQLS
jgi:metallo-beta-lactamase family protein